MQLEPKHPGCATRRPKPNMVGILILLLVFIVPTTYGIYDWYQMKQIKDEIVLAMVKDAECSGKLLAVFDHPTIGVGEIVDLCDANIKERDNLIRAIQEIKPQKKTPLRESVIEMLRAEIDLDRAVRAYSRGYLKTASALAVIEKVIEEWDRAVEQGTFYVLSDYYGNRLRKSGEEFIDASTDLIRSIELVRSNIEVLNTLEVECSGILQTYGLDKRTVFEDSRCAEIYQLLDNDSAIQKRLMEQMDLTD